jgi:hypothetical protein
VHSGIGVSVVAVAALALATGCSGGKKDTGAEFATRQVDGLTLPARVDGRSVEAATTTGFVPIFWAGVNLGSTIPGHQPGEVAATRQDYDRWLSGIGDLGARVIRIYTILRPSFYDALAAYNQTHVDRPLFFIQGVWLPGETEFDASGNAYTPSVTKGSSPRSTTPPQSSTATQHSPSARGAPPAHTARTSRAGCLRTRSGSSGTRMPCNRPTA